MYEVLASKTFQKQFRSSPKKVQDRIRASLKELETDPYEPRSGADIKHIKDTKPPKHRLRVGNYRIVYRIEGNVVKIIEMFIRGRGYR